MKKKFKVIKAWADVSSHGNPFMFAAGPVYNQYGPLMHIWAVPMSEDLVPIEIRIPLAPEKKKNDRKNRK